jgi:hypothetical protein
MLSGDCNACHFGTGRTLVYLNKSNGGTGLSKVGCLGCHGRTEDNNGVGTIGAGLRQHHYKAGETICFQCHNDANPANFKPVGENVPPPYYVTPDAAHPNKPSDSCNQSGKENYAASTTGLDNDGDGLYDAADPDCLAAAVCTDVDGDGYGSNGAATCTKGTAVDCNDNNATVNPGAADNTCNGIDENCSGTADEGYVPTSTLCGKGICVSTGQLACQNGKTADTCTAGTPQTEGPFGSPTCSDARDNNCNGQTDALDPNCAQTCVPATEVCDGKDNDCDGQVDEGIASTPTTCGVGSCASTGQSTCQGGKMVDTCSAGTPQTEGPFGSSACSDALDNDCDGLSDSADPGCAGTVCIDRDGDGYGANGDPSCPNGTAVDCNDRKASVNPGAVEVCDGVDNNCNGQIDENGTNTYYKDADRDGYGDPSVSIQSCKKPRRYVTDNTDCNDSDRKVYPNAEEICDGKDNNCNVQIDEGVQKTYYRDADRDGYGDLSVSIQSCRAPEGYVKNNTDCSDSNSSLHDSTAGICKNQGDNDNDEEEEDDDDDFIHNFTTGCISCHTPHNAITDCMSCHSGLNEK